MDVIGDDYLMINELDQNVIKEAEISGNPINKTAKGYYNPMEVLYSEHAKDNYSENHDPKSIIKMNHKFMLENKFRKSRTFFEEIPAIVAEGFRDPISLDANRSARFCLGWEYKCSLIYRINVRAMLSRLPGFVDYSSHPTTTLENLS